MHLILPPLDPDSPVPLYFQLFEMLKSRIQNGEIPSGDKIPSEKTISEQLSVSRITVKRAVNELAAIGLVKRQRGSGTHVSLNTDVPVDGGFERLHSTVKRLRKSTDGHLLSRSASTQSSAAHRRLKLESGTPLETITYSLFLKTAPFSYVQAHLPLEISQQFADSDIHDSALLTLLLQSGVMIVRAEQTISAVAANAAQAEALTMEIGAPLLEIHCIMIDSQGRPVMDITSYFPPEIYQYQMTLTDIV